MNQKRFTLPFFTRSTVARPSTSTGAVITKTQRQGGTPRPSLPAPTNAADLPLTVQRQTFIHPIKSQQ